MIKHNDTTDWDHKYEIIPQNIPKFLCKVSDKILRAGKYLNVIRECGKPIAFDDSDTLKFKHSEGNYIKVIESAYNFTSSALLSLILKENDLIGRLLSLKRYFLLQQGDFIAQFMDASEAELLKNVEKVTPMKIEKLLELTLRLSSAKYDKYQDDLKVSFLPYSIQSQAMKHFSETEEIDIDYKEILELTGIESFTFGYESKWPVSIVLNQSAITKYQMIFRLLYFCKHVERVLCRLWIENISKAKTSDYNEKYIFRSAHILCKRMIQAVQNIEYYTMVEVIEPNFHMFLEKLQKVNNIDEVLQYHGEFLEHCLQNCMITSPDLLECITELCNLCLEFSNLLIAESESKYTLAIQGKVDTFSILFTETLLKFLHKINEASSQNSNAKFVSLIHRINFNSVYTDRSETIKLN